MLQKQPERTMSGTCNLAPSSVLQKPHHTVLWFDLELTDFCSDWKGKIIVAWPPPELSWWRYANKNVLRVLAILEKSALTEGMPSWENIDLSWSELSLLPSDWKAALSEWRGVYLIFDKSDGKSYVGSCYGKENLFGRWTNYATLGHGGNKLLKPRNPENFQFTILQRLSPDETQEEVVRVEGTWKARLHTRQPFGLNEN